MNRILLVLVAVLLASPLIGAQENIRFARMPDLSPDGRSVVFSYYGDLWVVGSEGGVADGMKVDVEGNVYCTGPGGVHVIAPDGKLLGRLRVPGHCTNMGWGDDDWCSLYITTFTSVFKTRTRVPGIAVG